MKVNFWVGCIISFSFLFSGIVSADELVYRPVFKNPSQYSMLLQSASAQNNITDPDAVDYWADQDLGEAFVEDVTDRVLSEYASSIVSGTFGDDGDIRAGTFTYGAYTVCITEGVTGFNMSIETPNGITELELPRYIQGQ